LVSLSIGNGPLNPEDKLTHTLIHHGGAIADTVDRLRRISPPHPWEPLRQGLDEGGVAGLNSIMPTGQEKN
jgi:hypothetical protein